MKFFCYKICQAFFCFAWRHISLLGVLWVFLGLQYNNRTFNIRKVSTNESCLNTDPLIVIVHGSMWVCLLLFYRVIMDK